MNYNTPLARTESQRAHKRIVAAVRDRDPGRLTAELDAHRDRALELLTRILNGGTTRRASHR
jgi:DNA-binding GntR family transcriptional regulator